MAAILASSRAIVLGVSCGADGVSDTADTVSVGADMLACGGKYTDICAGSRGSFKATEAVVWSEGLDQPSWGRCVFKWPSGLTVRAVSTTCKVAAHQGMASEP